MNDMTVNRTMELNEKGQCPICKIKPLVYKTPPYRGYYCSRCDRTFNLETKQFQPGNLWDAPYEKSRLAKAADEAMGRMNISIDSNQLK